MNIAKRALPPKKLAGFTLLEVQIAVGLMLFAAAGMGALILHSIKQLKWIEMHHQLYDITPQQYDTAFFSRIYYLDTANKALNRVDILNYDVYHQSATAKITVTPRS